MLSLLICSIGCAGWTNEERITQAGYTALHVVDWMQTRSIAENPEQFREYNPVLGQHPDRAAVDAYFAATLAGHWLITDALPRAWTLPGTNHTVHPRKIWQWFWIGVEASCVVNNHAVGIRCTF